MTLDTEAATLTARLTELDRAIAPLKRALWDATTYTAIATIADFITGHALAAAVREQLDPLLAEQHAARCRKTTILADMAQAKRNAGAVPRYVNRGQKLQDWSAAKCP